jgi:hypothetical protein
LPQKGPFSINPKTILPDRTQKGTEKFINTAIERIDSKHETSDKDIPDQDTDLFIHADGHCHPSSPDITDEHAGDRDNAREHNDTWKAAWDIRSATEDCPKKGIVENNQLRCKPDIARRLARILR